MPSPVASPVVGATAGSTNVRTLTLGHGFRTTNGSNFAEVSGNVGIGTSSPDQKLMVNISTTSGVNGTVLNSYPIAKFINTDSGNAQRGLEIGANTGSVSSPIYLKVSGTSARFAIVNENNVENFTILSAGNVGIGTASPSGRLHVTDATDRTEITSQFQITGAGYTGYHFLDATAYYIGQNSNSRELRVYSGSSTAVGVRLTAGNNAWTTYSDERLKDIIEPIENAIEKVSTLRTVIGKYKTDDINKRRVFMFAQDVNAVLPEAVTEDSDGMLGMAFDHIVPLLTAAIKEQQVLISNLAARLAALESK
jgi:hypothetical protein